MTNLLEIAPTLALATACDARMQRAFMDLITVNKELGTWRSNHPADDEDVLGDSETKVGLELATRMQRLTGTLQKLSLLGMRLCDKNLPVINRFVESVAGVQGAELSALPSTVEAHRANFGRQLKRANKLAEIADQAVLDVWLRVAAGMPAGGRAN